MSKYAVMPLTDYADTCGAIRARINDQGVIKSGEMPMKITDVYVNGRDEGYQAGFQEGDNQGWERGYASGFDEGMSRADARYEEGLTAGKAEVYAEIEPINEQLENTLNGTDTGGKSFYDEFWDLYQQNGNRTDYQYGGFAGVGWTDETYKPKYPIKPIYAYGMYTGCRLTNILDIDTSKATSITNLFYVCRFLERVGIISAVSSSDATNVFSYCAELKTIDKFIVTEQLPYSNAFFNCTSLENLTIEGVIGQDGFAVQWSTKLSKASIISIINALSTTASGKSVTLSKVAVESAFGSTASEEWISLINTRSNWTINLV
jgi:hypothetical protein